MLLVAACLLAVVGGLSVWYFKHSSQSGGGVRTADLHHGGSGSGGSGGGNPRSTDNAEGSGPTVDQSALEKLKNTLEKQLQNTTIKSPTGGTVVTFEASDKGVVPWSSEPTGEGEALRGRISVPYKMESTERFYSSSRGRYILEFVPSGAAWNLKGVMCEAQISLVKGAENPIPEDDRQARMVRDTDFVVTYLKKVITKAAGPSPQ